MFALWLATQWSTRRSKLRTKTPGNLVDDGSVLQISRFHIEVSAAVIRERHREQHRPPTCPFFPSGPDTCIVDYTLFEDLSASHVGVCSGITADIVPYD